MSKKSYSRGITARMMQYLASRDGESIHVRELAQAMDCTETIAKSTMNNLRNREKESDGFYWRSAVSVTVRGQLWKVNMALGSADVKSVDTPAPKSDLGTMTFDVIARLDTGDLLLRQPGDGKLYQLKPIGY